MNSFNMRIGLVLVVILSLALSANVQAANEISAKTAINSFSAAYPQVEMLRDNGQITCIYGQPFGSGASPEITADQFRQNYSLIFGIDPAELRPVSAFNDQLRIQPLMFDQETGQYKFTLVYYSQYKSGIPVFRSELRLLVRNESNYPLVEAICALKDLGDYQVDASASSINPEQVQKAFLATLPQMINFSKPRLVVWAGDANKLATPALGVQFEAGNGQPATEKKIFIVDPSTGKTLFEQNLCIDVNVTGQVNGLVTPNFKAEQCADEVSTALPYTKVSIQSGNSAYADSTGHYTIINSGSSAVTVTSQVKGHWFQTINHGGSDSQLSLSVTPPGPANFLHNPSNTEYTRAEVNAYIHANIVRNFTLTYNPSYSVVDTETNFPLYVNDNDSYYCPGNAWYDGLSLTFCRAGSSYPNTAFSTVVHHEYGHHLVDMAGSGQGAYGEGMGDVMGLLITDNPGAAIGFYGDCVNPLRNANNTIQYPCTGEIHDCGQLISGCVWSTRNALAATYPSTYISILANLAINAMFLHTGEDITPQITIDYLTLDDNDGNIYNGTPHYSQICTGFSAHNMACPALQTGVFITHTPLGNTTSNSAYQVDAVITSTAGAIDSTLIYWSNGGSFQIAAMSNVGGSNYRGYIPGQANCTTMNYHLYATDILHNRKSSPASGNNTFYVGSFDTLLVNNVEGGVGSWTHSAVTSGYADQWAIRSHRNHTTGGANSWKFGSSSSTGTYSSSSDGGLVTPQILAKPSSRLKFWMWGEMEQSTATSAYDGARVEISVNGGAYTAIAPTAGYTHTTVGGYSHPWSAGTPCWSGSFDWTQIQFDLTSYANSNVRFRFRFGSDNSVNDEGWYIDDILVTAPRCDTVFAGTIAGTVTDINGSVANAIVSANDGAGHTGADTTAANGTYSFSMQVGTYSLSFHQIDHRDTTVTGVSITANNTTTVNMLMTRLPGIISGTVTSASSPLANVRVVVEGTSFEDTTAGNGAYAIAGLVDGTYSVAFSRPDYYDTTATGVLVTPGDATTLNMAMRKMPGWLEGTITDTAGLPMESVYVQINSGGTLLAGQDKSTSLINIKLQTTEKDLPVILSVDSLYTDASGHYLRGIASNNYHIKFSKSGYKDTTVNAIVVNPNDTTIVSPKMKPTNYPPVITSSATATATEDNPFRYIATATDANGTIPILAFSNYPAWLHVIADTIWGTPSEGIASTSFRIIASDGELTDTQVVALTVIPVNDPPVITSLETITATEHILMTYTATATDPDGTTPAISFHHYPLWLHVAGAVISGIPPESASDTSFIVIASDGLLADTMTVAVTVILVNDPPIIISRSVDTTITNQPYAYIAVATDPENNPLSFTYTRYPSWLNSIDSNVISGTPPQGSLDTSFVVIVSDGSLADTQTVQLIVVSPCVYILGDINGDGAVLGGDVTYGVRYFKGIGEVPQDSCLMDSADSYLYVAGDVNGSCSFKGSDITRLVSYFKGMSALVNCHFFPQQPLKENPLKTNKLPNDN